MPAPILTLPGKVDASHRLVIVASPATAGTVGTIGAVRAPLAMLLGTVTAANALVVRING